MAKPRSSFKKIAILVTVLAVPGFLYYLLEQKGQNRYKPLAYYGPKEVKSTFTSRRGKKIPDTLYHQISNFKLTDQRNRPFSFYSDKITLVNFFFTRCPGLCKNMNKVMDRVDDAFGKNDLVRLVSISVDPEYDQPAVLNQYAGQYNSRPDKWYFLTGERKEIYNIAKQQFFVNAMKSPESREPVHSPTLVLIDANEHIRGYYDSMNKDQVARLMDEIKVLITENVRNKSIR